MNTIDSWFIRVGLLFLLMGMAAGIAIGIHKQFQYTHLHSHTNVIGFVLSVLFGLIHRAYPDLRKSALAKLHFWLHLIGGTVFLIGIFVVTNTPANELPVIVGSLTTFTATALFAIMFFRQKTG